MREEEKRDLLDFATQTLSSLFSGEMVEEKEAEGGSGVFVTLRKNGSLRGCIGYLEPIAPLYSMVKKLVYDASFNDFRFPLLKEEEVKDIKIEISLLSPLKRIASLDEFTLKKDGLLMMANGRRALFLPVVAEETGWDRKRFLEELSLKAGLGKDAYLRSDAEFFTFQCEVIK